MAKININMDSLKERKEWVRHKIKDGSNILRFLPPFGEESNGYPYRKWFVIWGLLDPATGKARPFASPKTYEGKCPVFEYVDQLKIKSEQIKASMMQEGASEEEIKERLSAINRVIGNIKPKSAYVWNAVDKSGVLGLVELRSTAQKALKTLMSQYIIDYNQDPTSLNSADDDSGVWFNIKKSGFKLDTEYAVEKSQIKIRNANGKISFEDDREPLPENIVTDFEKVAYDLNSVYQKKTYDELLEILRANITLQAAENPDLAIEGFYYADDSAPIKEEIVEKPVQQQQQQVVKKNIIIKLDDDADEIAEEEGEMIAPTPVTPSRVIVQPQAQVQAKRTISQTIVPTTAKPVVINKPQTVVKPATFSKAPQSTVNASNNEDIMALAEGIFND